MDKKPVSFWLTEDELKKLKDEAWKKRMTVSDYIRESLKDKWRI